MTSTLLLEILKVCASHGVIPHNVHFTGHENYPLLLPLYRPQQIGSKIKSSGKASK
jgi:hypothetical protein